jgi:TfoX/Sxy family transcriptional regulator of competence genes
MGTGAEFHMAKQYVEDLTALIARLKPQTPRGKAIEIKPFFGGAAGYFDGRIFISLTKVGLALKLPEEDRRRLFKADDAKEMRYFPKAPVKKQYALLSDQFLTGRKRVKPWIERSMAFVETGGA